MYLVNVTTQVEMFRTNFLEKSCKILFPVHNIRECSFQDVISLKENDWYLYINYI